MTTDEDNFKRMLLAPEEDVELCAVHSSIGRCEDCR